MDKHFQQNKIQVIQGKANKYTESLTPKEWIDGETNTKITSDTKGVEQLSMLEPRNKDEPQTLKWQHCRNGRDCLNSQNSGYICMNKKLVDKNDRKKSLLMSSKTTTKSYDDSDLNTHSNVNCVPVESRKRDFKQLKLKIKRRQSLFPSSTSVCDLPCPRPKSEADIYSKQAQAIGSTNDSCRSHYIISENSREKNTVKSPFSPFHHSPKTLNDKASCHAFSKTEQDVLYTTSLKPRLLPPLNQAKSRPDSQLKILNLNVELKMNEATLISSSQQPQATASNLISDSDLTKPSQQFSSSCSNECVSVGYRDGIAKEKVRRSELQKCIENPFDGAINQKILGSLHSHRKGCDSKVKTGSRHLLESKSFQHLIPSNIYRNTPRDVSESAEGLNKVRICTTNNTIATSRRRIAFCESTDSTFRERMKTRVIRKTFPELTEGSLDSFHENQNDTAPRTVRAFGSITRLRRVGVCDNTDEFLGGRIKLRTMKKRFDQTEEFGREEKSSIDYQK